MKRLYHLFSFWLLLFLFSTPELSLGASEKALDNFSSSTFGYYFTSGLTASTNTTQFIEGNSSLRLNYNLSPGNSGEVLRSYGTNTLDLSFMPAALSLWVKGQSAQFPQFRFMLYEDNDMDGNPFEAGEDIYEYISNTALSNTAWTEVVMNYASFTKFGGGSSTLNLNRINAWRIYLYNSGASTITGTVYIDHLRQLSSYTPPATGTAKINGTFLQLWNDATCGSCGTWTQSQWETQMQYMKDVCIDQVVVQYGVWTTAAWYSPSTLSGVSSFNAINRIIAAANVKNISVYIGLYFDGEFDAATAANSTYYNTLLTKNQTVIDDLWTLFGSQPSFKGWYIPQEIHDLYWRTPAEQTLLANWLQNTAAYAKSKSAAKKVLLAPYYGPWAPADYTQNWYNTLLTTVNAIDIIIPQDGVGTYANWGMGPPHNKDLDIDVPAYLTAIKAACTAHGVTFGVDVEAFNDPSPRTPAPINRFKNQLWEAAQYTPDQIFQFAWLYMQPGLDAQTQQFYNDYKLYSSCAALGIDQYSAQTNSQETLDDVQVLYTHEGCQLIVSDQVRRLELFTAEGKTIPIKLNGEHKIYLSKENFQGIGILRFEVNQEMKAIKIHL